jgi:hypothetical protein
VVVVVEGVVVVVEGVVVGVVVDGLVVVCVVVVVVVGVVVVVVAVVVLGVVDVVEGMRAAGFLHVIAFKVAGEVSLTEFQKVASQITRVFVPTVLFGRDVDHGRVPGDVPS